MHESGEMYLETIFVLTRENAHVRSIDICEHMGYSKPSISRAMGILRENGLIEMEHNGQIHLTESGLQMAEAIYERHRIICDFLINMLGVSPDTAENDACKIEHIVSNETFAAIKKIQEEAKLFGRGTMLDISDHRTK